LIAGIEKEYLEIAVSVRLQQLQDVLRFPEELPHAHVDAQRHAQHRSAFAEHDRFRSKNRREVIDTEKAEILERMQRLRFSRSGKPGYDDDRWTSNGRIHLLASSEGGRTARTHAELSVVLA
jgi:hypothetical protein